MGRLKILGLSPNLDILGGQKPEGERTRHTERDRERKTGKKVDEKK